MDAGNKAGEVIGRWIVEHRAQGITDPVAKLRYLKGAATRTSRPARRNRESWWWSKPVVLAALLLLPIPTISDVHPRGTPPLPTSKGLSVTATATPMPTGVWLVEETKSYETYSNGLRIDNRYSVGNEKRLYPVYAPDTLELKGWQSGPIGIVFHTTESHQAPFSPNHNSRLRRVGRWALEYVQQKKAYHFVIDRFGQVHRIVQETDSANHAGYSVWADDQNVYVNLNPSFLGISFETETQRTDEGATITEAQVHAANVLTHMLRSKYGIPARNCVTHAQVSVFSRAMLVGNHVDWAANFPFAALGLGDNYAQPHAAIAVFGFEYGPEFLSATGAEMWKGLAFGEDLFRQQAAASGDSVTRYRTIRRERYREILEAIEEATSPREYGS